MPGLSTEPSKTDFYLNTYKGHLSTVGAMLKHINTRDGFYGDFLHWITWKQFKRTTQNSLMTAS